MRKDLIHLVDRVFAHALNTVKRIPRTGSARPPTEARLKLYGLYKQSMEGDVEGVMQRPPDDAPDTEETRAEKEKWDAWHSNASLSRTTAKREYISTLITTMHEYASSTPEARELVAELEFVWDQIKNNSNNTSTESSPRSGGGVDSKIGMGYSSLGSSRRRVMEDEGGGIGLRVLRPVSEGDDETYDDDDDEDDDGVREGEGIYRDPTNPMSQMVGGSKGKDLDIRNRKWRKRVETALFKMTTEVAALREQIEATRIGKPHGIKDGGVWTWLRWLIWVATRQLLVDMTMLGLLFLWARRTNHQGIQQGLWLVMQALKEQLRQIRGLKHYTHLIPSLEKSLITTTDLLTLDPLEIAKRAQLPLLDVRRLANHVLASLQSQLGVIDGKEALRKYEDSPELGDALSLRGSGCTIISKGWSAISTLDPVLDTALGGGIPTNYITEITGESGAGKTQFLLSLLLAAQLRPPHGLSRPTVYISTEHPLPTSRLAQLIRSNHYLSALPASAKPSLTQIFSIQTPDLESQDHILAYQLPVLLARHHIGLVVIDSIAANYRAERSSSSTSGAALGLRSSQLVQLGHQLRRLAREYDCAIVVSNQVADRFAPIPSSSPPQGLPGSSPPSVHSLSSPPHPDTNQAMQSLNTAVIVPPPAFPITTPAQTSTTHYPLLTLDHQQNFFTGWSCGPHNQYQNQNLKTPSLGLVWTNQIACRIALVKERAPIKEEGESKHTSDGVSRTEYAESTPRPPWKRFMKVVFSSWAPATGVDEEEGRGTEFEIWSGGLRALAKKKKE
ncbi:MAG: hypothetical protein Q9172_006017 [Xanthocarpia lactea]